MLGVEESWREQWLILQAFTNFSWFRNQFRDV